MAGVVSNESDIIVARALSKVRSSGLVNMYYIKGVIEVLEEMEEDFTADYLRKHIGDYLSLLKLSTICKTLYCTS